MRRSWALAAALSALGAFLPFAPLLEGGRTLYFRDLGGEYIPFRLFTLESLAHGGLWRWNPYAYEGAPLARSPLASPVELLALLDPTERGVSLALALHLPLAAIAFVLLGRQLGLAPAGACAGGLVVATGGFALSLVNLYPYALTLPFGLFAALGLRAAATGGRREVARAGVAFGISLACLGLEIALQAALLGLITSLARQPSRWLRALAVMALGVGLSAAATFVVAGLVSGSEREAGFRPDVALAYSVHPLSLLQTLLAAVLFDPSQPVNRFWGFKLVPEGFPYVQSLYLGPTVLAAAAVGFWRLGRERWRWLAPAALALIACLGAHAGLQSVFERIPAPLVLRYPVKAFFTVHVVAAIGAALGVSALARGLDSWTPFARAVALLAASLLALGTALGVSPNLAHGLAALLLPASFPDPRRAQAVWGIARDAVEGGVITAGALVVALAVRRGAMRSGTAAKLLALLIGADLLRAGSGLNPVAPIEALRPEPEVQRVADDIRGGGGRLFTCDPVQSAAFRTEVARRAGRHEVLLTAVTTQLLSPFANMRAGVRTAFGLDRTMLVPQQRVFTPEEASCTREALVHVVPRLRRAGVSHILSLDGLDHPELSLSRQITPRRLAPMAINLYALRDPLPTRHVARAVRAAGSALEATRLAAEAGFLASGGAAVEGGPPVEGGGGEVQLLVEEPDRLEFRVRADRETFLVVRDAWAPGWSAVVDGRDEPVRRADGRHRAIRVPMGESLVALRYQPPLSLVGIAVSCASALAAALAFIRRPSPAPANAPAEA